MIRTSLPAIVISLALTATASSTAAAEDASQPDAPPLLVGAAVTDVTPQQYPVLVNGGFRARKAEQVKTQVNARSIVIRQGDEQIALVVVDSCMLPKFLLDEAKLRASQQTQLRPERIMISATHTHTAPSAFGALGTPADPSYVPFLRERLVQSLVEAEANLQPARYAWGTADAAEFTALRRWVYRPDRVQTDPFGNPTVRATMHSARNLDDVTGPTGPEDPELSMLAFETLEGRPLAVLANFSMHYYGDAPISADYFGLFCAGLEERLGRGLSGDLSGDLSGEPSGKSSELVAVLSHGCSGDIWRRDYFDWDGNDETTIESYTEGLLAIATELYDSLEFRRSSGVAMAQATLPMRYRVPDQQRLEWAQSIVDAMEEELPQTRVEVYAKEQLLLHEMQSTEVIVQALRIGEVAIATTPNETYALTGLKIKARSPLEQTMVIELANGADGYIPPPEQHHLGGYNTWAARSAGLEERAEPRIAAAAVSLLERVSGQPRRAFTQSLGPASRAILDQQPLAYWRFDEMEPPLAVDAAQQNASGAYEPGVLFFLEGPQEAGLTAGEDINRCAHFAGGRMRSHLGALGDTYSVVLWLWNGMPDTARGTTGWAFSRDFAHGRSGRGDHLGLGGTATTPGRVIFAHGDQPPLVGKTQVQRWSWNRLLLVRDGERVRIYLNQNETPEIDAEVGPATEAGFCFVGGRSDNLDNFEGRIDEVAVFDRVLTPSQLER